MRVEALSVVPLWIGVVVLFTDTGECDQLNRCIPTALLMLRMFRLLRLIKRLHYFDDSAVLAVALSRSARPLLVPLFVLVLLTFTFAGVIYYVEGVLHGSSEFNNIFKAAWFVLVTLSTVGYGDITPDFWLGKLVSAVAILTGVLALAIPIAIVGNEFQIAWQEREIHARCCVHTARLHVESRIVRCILRVHRVSRGRSARSSKW